jgi:hypothetical protein
MQFTTGKIAVFLVALYVLANGENIKADIQKEQAAKASTVDRIEEPIEPSPLPSPTPVPMSSATAFVDVAGKSMTYKGRKFVITASEHTPRGQFTLEGPVFNELEKRYTIPFLTIAIDDTPKNNPQYKLHQQLKAEGVKAAAYVIHDGDTRDGSTSAGCVLVSPADLSTLLSISQTGDSIEIK